ncbi:MAG TPA: DUF1801 domain-containing protein [Steroidobacteraceae bacterium]
MLTALSAKSSFCAAWNCPCRHSSARRLAICPVVMVLLLSLAVSGHGETYKSVVKMTFAKGAHLKDPSRLFNSSLEGNTRRAIDFHEGERINEAALMTLVRAAVSLNHANEL